MEKNCRFGSSLASSAILSMFVYINDSSSKSRYVSFPQIRTLASPFPPTGTVAAPFGSPAVPHLRRYYGVVRLLRHPSAPPPVDPWVHVPPELRGVPLGVGGDGELSWVPG